MKRAISILATTFALILMASAGEAVADITVVPGGYYVNTDRVAYKYEPNGVVTISDFGLTVNDGPKHVVFTFISTGPFEPTGIPIERGRMVSVTGLKALIETHDSPHATLVYRALEPGIVTFSLDSKMGAVPRGSSVVIGDSEFLADLAVTNGRTVTKSVDSLTVNLMSDDVVAFRVQGPSGSLSDLMVTGELAVELDVRTRDVTIDSDETVFQQSASIAVEVFSERRASFSFSGLDSNSVAVIDLSNELYAKMMDHMTLNVGGSSLRRFSSMGEFVESSEQGFLVAEGVNYVEILLRPGVPSGSIMIENITPGFEPLLAVAGLASTFTCVAAGAYLFRRESN